MFVPVIALRAELVAMMVLSLTFAVALGMGMAVFVSGEGIVIDPHTHSIVPRQGRESAMWCAGIGGFLVIASVDIAVICGTMFGMLALTIALALIVVSLSMTSKWRSACKARSSAR